MPMPQSSAPVVVGIDGSAAALEAARWGAAEAISRTVPLRLIHVVDVEADLDPDLDEDPAAVASDWPETTHGLQALAAASTAVHDLGGPISVESQIVYGEVDSTLVDESGHASLLCLGSTGITPICRRLLGSTAATLAESGRCPVAVIRTPSDTGTSTPDPHWIVMAVHGGPDDDRIVDYALNEARLRRAPVLAVDVSHNGDYASDAADLRHRVSRWQEHHPSVHVYPVHAPATIAGFLSQQDDLRVQLAVLGSADVRHVVTILGSDRETGRPTSGCSVLVVR
ncbi:universal stress protein [Mycobacterium sp. AT1]|uniref:universal stress protein n=1 Tax=Mycobacterium sp. AT1 TaxID=1961706 RepID=UPI0009AE0CB0|nr:universal stress protein [Mycobacterium sp. AT1]OPX08935.1 hypothetical protein B1790_16935 [Mycobacterium sp. AT1]